MPLNTIARTATPGLRLPDSSVPEEEGVRLPLVPKLSVLTGEACLLDIWWSDAQPVDPGCRRFHRGESTGPRRSLRGAISGNLVPRPSAGRRVVGCVKSDVASELPVRSSIAGWGDAPLTRLGGYLRAVEARLSGAVPLHPTARPAGPRRRRQGPRDPGAPPPTRRAASAGSTPQAPTRRPRPPRAAQPGTATLPLVVLLCNSGHAAVLASAAGRRCLDLPALRNRTTAARPGDPAADRPPGQRERPLGRPAHPG